MSCWLFCPEMMPEASKQTLQDTVSPPFTLSQPPAPNTKSNTKALQKAWYCVIHTNTFVLEIGIGISSFYISFFCWTILFFIL